MNTNFKSPIVILANGSFPNHSIPLEILESAGTVICTDGSANSLEDLDLMPHVIIGDMDSFKETKAEFKGLKIHDPNQENTDLEKALDWAVMNKIQEITILGATGLREDLAMVNHYILFHYYDALKLEMVTDHFTITCHRGQKSFDAFPGETVSLITQRFGTVVSTTALHYPLDNSILDPSTLAVSNKSLGDTFSVNASEPILVFRGHPER
ncbi:MAG: thiamine diphosphokinase [Candidatus Marinimicrobia bacterium]|nr:thiamine diphosphokinase [Candidatus Neomarinimicrobiota bacterium]MBL7011253.1 thiamine diphosphokinase [Candidatus Neomarinimicrobiota bacterium]MBL7031475.1 thiamine diphosphokinase [Candidatus Neomarinimicrobiota bacterium]